MYKNEHDTVTAQDFLKTIFFNPKEQSSNELFRLRALVTSQQTQLLAQANIIQQQARQLLLVPERVAKKRKVFNPRTCAKPTCTRIVIDMFVSGKFKKQCRPCIISSKKKY